MGRSVFSNSLLRFYTILRNFSALCDVYVIYRQYIQGYSKRMEYIHFLEVIAGKCFSNYIMDRKQNLNRLDVHRVWINMDIL